jgi:hypothetical protein
MGVPDGNGRDGWSQSRTGEPQKDERIAEIIVKYLSIADPSRPCSALISMASAPIQWMSESSRGAGKKLRATLPRQSPAGAPPKDKSLRPAAQ